MNNRDFLKDKLYNGAINNSKAKSVFKRIMIGVVVFGLVLFIGVAAILGIAVSKINNMVANKPDIEMLALQKLISSNEIVLTEQQKTDLSPLVDKLVQGQSNGTDAEQIKAQIMSVLDQKQQSVLGSWKGKMETDASGLLDVGRNTVAESISSYTGISKQESIKLINSVSAWLNLNGSGTSVPIELQKQLENTP